MVKNKNSQIVNIKGKMYVAVNLCTPLYNGSTKYLNTYRRIIYDKSIRYVKHSEISAVFF